MASLSQKTFPDLYECHEQLGKGAFSTVLRCTSKLTGREFAVKMIDLRPLRLRPTFDMRRLRREVEIMQHIDHENIVKLQEVFEDTDYLLMVMEYIPGVELFDDILARKKYSENDARPVFNQIASAVGYLHERHIVHRDIKPENIKVIAGSGGQATSVRLLDFGLSKDLNEGGMPSVGRTFVGTPCYLAPEVELVRNDGSGPGYGVEVDCWSLGAVLYVMLVARFPEFDRTSGSPMVKLDGELWQSVSAEARDLIRQLMTPDPSKRMTVTQALQHPWMLCQLDGASNASPRGEVVREGEGSLGTSMESVSADQMSSLVGSVERMSTEDRFPTDSIVPRAAVRRPGGRPVGLTSPSDALITAEDARHRQATGFLIVLHLKVSKLFAAALQTYQSPSLSLKIRERAFLGRAQLEATVTVLRKLDALSMQIVDGLKEVMEAVKEDVPMLAHNILELQRQWVTKLRQEMLQVKQSNTALMQSLNHLIDDVESSSVLSHMPHQDVPSGGEEPSVQQVGDLPVLRMQGDYGALVERMRDTDHISGDQFLNLLMPTVETSPPVSPGRGKSAAEERSLSPLHRLSFLLQQIDQQLEGSSLLWSNLEVAFDMVLQKGDTMEQFVDFATNPRLMERFKARLDDYQFIWNSIRENAVMNLGRDEVFRIYGYLDQTPSVAAAAQELPVSGLSTADFSGGM